MKKVRSRIQLSVLLSTLLVAAPMMADVLGQVALNEVRIDGSLVPTGTTVLSPSLLETGSHPTTVHLSTGQTLSLGPTSSARLSGVEGGRISVAAETGNVRIGNGTGEVFKLAANTVAVLDQEIGSGDPVTLRSDGCEKADEARVCDEDNNLICWPAADLANCKGCSIPDYNEPEDPEDDVCRKKGAGFLVWTPGKAVVVVGGATVLGLVVGEEINDGQVVQCQARDASPFIPGIPICTT